MKIALFTRNTLTLFALILGTSAVWAGTPPISGPDEFEPDNEPKKARFMALNDENDSSRIFLRRNFDRPGDVDWAVFNVKVPLFVFVRTTALFSEADTFISVYRLVNSNTPVGEPPEECTEERILLTADLALQAVACNDDVNINSKRSEVFFDVDTPGYYFVRIKYSTKPRFDKGTEDPSGPQTTYGVEATYFGVVPGGIVVSVFDAVSEAPLTTAIVREQTMGINVTTNTNGVYNLGSLGAETYSIRVEAPGYLAQTQPVSVSGGNFLNVAFPMEPTPPRHSLDYTEPYNDLSLAELLRGIQFFNIGEFGCDPLTEDNYSPGLGGKACAKHSGDYSPQDWKFNLSEILRLIQIYNAPNGYQPCEDGEDGYCPIF